ncbi:MAG: hypothetical protein PW999_00785 [Paraburkholderia tropica]|nr:hypothetical protein [Paraburkholderia tropica]
MATIVDALIVTLGLDATAFKRGKAEATQTTKKLTAEELRAAKEIEARNKKAADSFRAVRNELLALLALFTAGLGIKEFTEQTIKGAIATGQLARDLGMVRAGARRRAGVRPPGCIDYRRRRSAQGHSGAGREAEERPARRSAACLPPEREPCGRQRERA